MGAAPVNSSLSTSIFNSSLSQQNGTAIFNYDGYLFPFSYVILLGSLMSLLSLTTVLGNVLVIVAFIVDKRLRNHSCYFLVNLAVCDFFVGSVSIPGYIYPTLTGRWRNGRIACKLYLTLDSTVCISSVYSILLITYDRFLSVTKAISYRGLQGSHEMFQKTLVQIGAAWLVAFLLSAPAIVLWDIAIGHSDVPEGICTYEFNNAWHFLIILTLTDFYAPFLCIAYFNLSIYCNIRKRSSKRKNTLLLKSTNNKPVVSFTLESKYSHQEQKLPYPVKLTGQQLFLSNINKKQVIVKKLKLPKNYLTKNTSTPILNPGNVMNQASITEQLKLKKDKQIARSLAVIVGVYCICWLPYTLILFIQAICRGQCFEPYISEIVWWLLWMNSSINPFLYPLCHKKFRRAFATLLCHVV